VNLYCSFLYILVISCICQLLIKNTDDDDDDDDDDVIIHEWLLLRLDEAKMAVADTRDEIERQHRQIANNEAEMNRLRRRIDTCDIDREKNKKQMAVLQAAVVQARIVSATLRYVSLIPLYFAPRSTSHDSTFSSFF